MLCRLRQKEDAPRIAKKMNETSKGGSGLCIAYIHIDRVLPLDIGIHGRGGGGNYETKGTFQQLAKRARNVS